MGVVRKCTARGEDYGHSAYCCMNDVVAADRSFRLSPAVQLAKRKPTLTRLGPFGVLAGSPLAFAIAMAFRIPLTMTVEANLPALSLKYQLYPLLILLRGRA